MSSSLSRCRLLVGLACLAFAVGGCGTSATARNGPIHLDFSADTLGKPPADFTTALTGGGGPVAWVVRADPGAPGSGKMLVQESTDDTSYRFPLCVYDPVTARDVAATVRFQSIAGNVDQAAGIVLRYRPENYYIARANSLEDNVDIFKTVNGKRTLVQEVTVKYAAGEWHTLGFTAKGSHLTVTFDGTVVIALDDTTFTGPGKVGLWTKADSVSAFTDLCIAPAP